MNYLEAWIEHARTQREQDARAFEAMVDALLEGTDLERADLEAEAPPGGSGAGGRALR